MTTLTIRTSPARPSAVESLLLRTSVALRSVAHTRMDHRARTRRWIGQNETADLRHATADAHRIGLLPR